ncbi:hypothetical protein SKAU_G00423440 [Synaphobranchus kaupii]|uniref:Uncharacterized protein n=1 Tax=Synaphobranchus kaupii TaxID=118154 RepID=A0A9Q1E5H4_SYNKA|nr:hypothetical protein SKAU_G00423440 [Synaphobranchus kaupii]
MRHTVRHTSKLGEKSGGGDRAAVQETPHTVFFQRTLQRDPRLFLPVISARLELDLRYNHPGDSGVRALSAAKLDTLTLLVDHGGENRTKPGPRKYGCRFTLDPNTAHRELSLSEGNRKSSSR